MLLYDLIILFPIKLDTSRNELIDNNEKYYIIERIYVTLCKLIEEKIKMLGVKSDRDLIINNDFLYFLLHREGYTM